MVVLVVVYVDDDYWTSLRVDTYCYNVSGVDLQLVPTGGVEARVYYNESSYLVVAGVPPGGVHCFPVRGRTRIT